MLIGVVSVIAVAWLTVLFAPWTLWTRSHLDESLPTTADVGLPGGATQLAAPVTEMANGRFIRQEHKVAGTARLLKLPDGQRILRLENFATSDGPDLHVWLSEKAAGGNWFKYARGRSIRLGALKATDGNHNYPIPADEDLAGLSSAVIWCRRFRVAFGSAPLAM